MIRLSAISIVANFAGEALASNGAHVDHAVVSGVTGDTSLIETEIGPVRNNKFTQTKMALKHKSSRASNAAKYSTRHADVAGGQLHIVASDTDSEATVGSKAPGDSTPVTRTWRQGKWSECSASCGTGSRYRTVECVASNGEILKDSMCPSEVRPTNRMTCTGDCLKCDVNSKFIKGIGVPSAPTTPTKAAADQSQQLCQVNSQYSCCPAATQSQMLVSYYQLKRGLTAQTQHRDANKVLLQEAYDKIVDVIGKRIAEGDDAIDRINEAIESTPSNAAGDAVQLRILRESLATTLGQRSDSLQVSIADLATAQSELFEQLDVMDSIPDDDEDDDNSLSESGVIKEYQSSLVHMLETFTSGWFSAESRQLESQAFDDSDLSVRFTPSAFLARRAVSTIHYDSPHKHPKKSAAKEVVASSFLQAAAIDFSDPTLRVVSKTCQKAINNHFIGMSCASCNPTFPVFAREFPETPYIEMSSGSCSQLSSACEASLLAAHWHMEQGMNSLLNSHANMITLVAQVQPLLDRVWNELRLDWLPGFSAPQVAKPDLTRMQCVQDLKVFRPFQVNNATDFCTAYFQFASPKAFVKRVSNQLDRGLVALGKFASCDKCLHDALMFLSDVLGPSTKGSLRVTLPTRAKAMISSCGGELPRLPRVSEKSAKAKTLPDNYAKMTSDERTSSRVVFARPGEMVETKAFNVYANVTESVSEQPGGSPPHEWRGRSLYKEDNITKRQLAIAVDSLRSAGPDAFQQVHVMNLNCTKHTECYHQDAPSGMRPWWFCAHPNLCSEQPGACTEEGEALFESGPKCVRGPCTHHLSAIDKQCPDNAICPAQVGSLADRPEPFFGPDYFAKFDTKTRADDPLAVSAALRGVCDCAFDANGVVLNKCEYARCLAYASLLETGMSCNAGLVGQCSAIKAQNKDCFEDATLSCTDKDTILSYPPDLPGECRANPTALEAETSGVSGKSVFAFLGLVAVTALF